MFCFSLEIKIVLLDQTQTKLIYGVISQDKHSPWRVGAGVGTKREHSGTPGAGKAVSWSGAASLGGVIL